METGGFSEAGEELCAAALREYLQKLPQYSEENVGCRYHEYVAYERFEEAFSDLGGILWRNKKRFSDEILNACEQFLVDFESDYMKNAQQIARNVIVGHREITVD